MEEQKQDDQLEPIYNNSVPIQDVASKTYRERWTIETSGESRPERSVLEVQHDDDDDDIYIYIYSISTISSSRQNQIHKQTHTKTHTLGEENYN